jgi:hypothetical protein
MPHAERHPAIRRDAGIVTKRPVKNTAQSVRDRLLMISRETRQDYQRVMMRYVAERLLARLAETRYRELFVLKGAMLYVVWDPRPPRTTKDLDLLGFGTPDPQRMRIIFQEICKTATEDDGLSFEESTVEAIPIREDAIYDGVRVTMRVRVGRMPMKLQVDVGFGDKVVPAPEVQTFPPLLHENGPQIRMYRPETSIAEKLHAIVALGIANSRMKDYYDIWFLSNRFPFDLEILAAAIRETFTNRQTPIPDGIPIGLSDDFAAGRTKQLQWTAFVRKAQLAMDAPPFSRVVEAIRQFLLPALQAAGGSMTWTPARGWESSP